MAAASFYLDTGLEDETSDIGVLWDQALRNYLEKCGVDLRATARDKWNMSTIEAEQARQLDLFKKFRHNQGALDKLRTLVGRNTKIIQTVATHVANAACSAFPPSAAILTAFNYCLNASQAMSEDYDMVVSFFDVMNSFLERMMLLEARLPPDRAYQKFVMNVFNALLDVCAIAKKYRDEDHGRVRKWAKAMFEGNDSKLKSSYVQLNTQLQLWESATLVMTLKTAIDSSRKIEDVQAGQQAILSQGQEHMSLTMQIRTMTVESSASQKEALSLQKKTLGLVEALSMRQNDSTAGQQLDAGARKPAALRRVKSLLGCPADVKGQFDEYKSAYVQETLDWVSAEPGYKAIRDEESRLWCVTGTAGMGKSMVAYKTILNLQHDFRGESSCSVAYFFFRNDLSEFKNPEFMLHWCAVQAAEGDERYREDILTDIQRGQSLWDVDPEKQLEKLWTRLYTSKYGKDSGRRIILVLDGIDQPDDKERGQLAGFIREVLTTDLRIQIVCTSDSHFEIDAQGPGIQRLDLNKERLKADMKVVVMDRTRKLPRLRKLSRRTRVRIVKELTNKANDMAYVEHTLRRLESIGREGPVLKELSRLPESSTALYELLLRDCARGRNEGEAASLRKLLAWIAYSKTLMSLPLLHRIVEKSSEEGVLNVEEELQYRSAKLLRFYNRWADEEEEAGSSGDERAKSENGSDVDEEEESRWMDERILIGFHDRSLRLFFRKQDLDGQRLRSGPTLGNLIIFDDIAAVLFTPVSKNFKLTAPMPERSAVRYATMYWKDHLRDINRGELTDEQATRVVQHLHDIIHNKGGALKWMEGFNYYAFSALGDSKEESEKNLDIVTQWARHALELTPPSLPTSTLETMRNIVRDPKYTFLLLARGHVGNWYGGNKSVYQADKCFQMALASLELGLEALSGNTELRAFFKDFKWPSVKYLLTPPLESFRLVASAFPDITKDATADRAIAGMMARYGYLKTSIDMLRSCFDRTTEQNDLYELHHLYAKALYPTEEDSRWLPNADEFSKDYADEDDAARKARVTAALEQLNAAIALQPDKIEKSDDGVSQFMALSDLHARRIQAELELGRTESLAADMEAYINDMARHGDSFKNYTGIDLAPIVPALAKSSQWSEILRLMRMVKKKERVRYFANAAEDDRSSLSRLYFEEAGVRTGDTASVLEAYNDVDADVKSFYWAYPKFVERRAVFHYMALRTPADMAEAKRLLNGVLDSVKDGQIATLYVGDASGAAFRLADLLLEQFRAGRTSAAKTAALDEMKILVARMAEIIGKGFDPSQSQLTIPLALMMRRLGPAADYQQTLDKAFRGCVESLRDNISWNDAASFRMLAKALACVSGLESEASVAFTCELYVVDMDLYKKEMEADGQDAEKKAKDSSPSSPDVEADGDLDRDAAIACSDCGKKLTDWRHGAAYLCYCCAELNLCEACYDKRAAIERGEREADWRVLCPPGHKHVKGPAEGWRGLKDGVLRIGETEIKFEDWLTGLTAKWEAAWSNFWDD